MQFSHQPDDGIFIMCINLSFEARLLIDRRSMVGSLVSGYLHG